MILGEFFKNFFKYLFLAILCLVPIVLLGAGVYCSMALYKEKTNISQNFGTLKQHDLYEDFNVFDCDLSSATFYKSEGGNYEYTTTIPKAVQFDGSENKYNVLINNQPSTNEQSTAGILTAKNTINYYSIEGNEIQQTVLTIEMRFYQSKVQISIKTNNTAEQQALFLEYIQFNGLKLRTIKAQYVPTVSASEYCTITFLGKDGELVALNKVAKGGLITVPQPPEYTGYIFTDWAPAIPKYAIRNATFTANYRVESGNLLTQSLVYDIQPVNLETTSVSISEAYTEFCEFPYELEVQVCYFADKKVDNYEVLESSTLKTFDDVTMNGRVYENAQAYKNFTVNSNVISFSFNACYNHKVVDGVVVLGDKISRAEVVIDGSKSLTPNAQYLYDHIKIIVTSIKTIRG